MALFSCLWGTLAMAAEAPRPAEAPIAFVKVTVVPMDTERLLPGHTVLVQGDRIIAVVPSSGFRLPAGTHIIDGRGKFLIPGMGEMHGHNPPLNASWNYTESVYFMFLANGVTTVRSMDGAPGQLELREQIRRGDILGPTTYMAGPSFSGVAVRSPAQAEERVRGQKAEGWDLLKVQSGLSRDAYDAMARTAREVGIAFGGHIPAAVGLEHAIASGQQTIEHLQGYMEYLDPGAGPLPPPKLAEVVKLTREAGAWVVPTMALSQTGLGIGDLEALMNYPELKYMPPADVAKWKDVFVGRSSGPQFNRARAEQAAANRRALLRALSDGGVRILFGTDAPQRFSVPGFSIHREMQVMAEAGLSPYQILRTATKHVGEYYREKDRFGIVAVAHRADLVLLNGNPLADISQVANRSGVMVRGRWLEEQALAARLSEFAQAGP